MLLKLQQHYPGRLLLPNWGHHSLEGFEEVRWPTYTSGKTVHLSNKHILYIVISLLSGMIRSPRAYHAINGLKGKVKTCNIVTNAYLKNNIYLVKKSSLQKHIEQKLFCIFIIRCFLNTKSAAYIRMISEGSCDTEGLSDGCGNTQEIILFENILEQKTVSISFYKYMHFFLISKYFTYNGKSIRF